MGHLKNKNTLIFFSLSVFFTFSAVTALPLIPETESDISEIIEKGSADSILYVSIKPFYSNPVSVPEGELLILQDFFPDLFKNVPSETAALEKYRPWNRDKIKSFFNDYPQLVVLKPLLSFTCKSKRLVKVEFSSRGDLKKQNYAHAGQILIQPSQKFCTNIRMAFNDSSFDMVYRSASVQVTPLLKVNLGNFNTINDNGMFYGFFPVDSVPDSVGTVEKVFFSSGGNWNGICISLADLSIGSSTNISSEITFHKRFTETVSSCSFNLNLKPLKCRLGLSYLKLPLSTQLLYYGQFSALVRLGDLSLESNVGIDIKNFNVPVTIEGNFEKKNNSFGVRLMVLPEGFQPPRSRWLKLYSKNCNPLPYDILILTIRSNHHIRDWINLCTTLEALHAADVMQSLNVSIGCNGNIGKIDYVLDISKKQFGKSISDTSVLTLQSYVDFSIIDSLIFNSTIKMTSVQKDQYSVQLFSGFSFSKIEPLKIESSIQLKVNQTGIYDVACVLNQTLSLLEKTNVFVQIRIPFTKKSYGGIDVQAKMSFVF